MAKTEFGAARDVSGENGVFDIVYTVKGVFISYVVSIMLLAVAAFAAVRMGMGDGGMRIVVNIIYALGVIICGFTVSKRARKSGLVNGVLAGLLYAVLLYAIGSLITQDFSVSFSTLSALITAVICGGLGGIIGVNFKGKRRR